MVEKSQIQTVVLRAIDRVNDVLLDENVVMKSLDTILFGQGAVLDSMGFINFIVALEEMLVAETGLSLNLVEEMNAPGSTAPKQATVGEFVEFVFRLVQPQD